MIDPIPGTTRWNPHTRMYGMMLGGGIEVVAFGDRDEAERVVRERVEGLEERDATR